MGTVGLRVELRDRWAGGNFLEPSQRVQTESCRSSHPPPPTNSTSRPQAPRNRSNRAEAVLAALSSKNIRQQKLTHDRYLRGNGCSAPHFKWRTSGWRDPAASSSGVAPSWRAGCGGPAAGRWRVSVWPGPARRPCGLLSGGHHGPGSSLHPPGS